jgi:hypothetical protein
VMTTIEFAWGIFIAAVVIGTVVYIMVRIICKALTALKQNISNAVYKATLSTNGLVSVDSALFFGGYHTNASAPPNVAPMALEFTAGDESSMRGRVQPEDTLPFSDLLNEAGLIDALPKDSANGDSIIREGDGYAVTPLGFTNFVTLTIERLTDGLKEAGERLVKLRVPAGARLSFSDGTMAASSMFYRIQAQ